MTSRIGGAIAVAAMATCVSPTTAAVVTVTNQSLWTAYSSANGASIVTEDFTGIADGFYAGSFSSSVGGIAWTAAAPGGLYVDQGLFSTNYPEPLTFTFSPGVQGVAGNIFGTDINFDTVLSVVQVTLNDGSSYIGYATAASDFIGFYSTDAAISSLTITILGDTPGGIFPTVDNLYFAVVPAPGAIALLGVAGILGRRNRR